MNLIDRNGIVHSDPLHVQRHPEEIDYTRTEHDTNGDSRFWVVDLDPVNVPEHAAAQGTFGSQTLGIVDEYTGGIIAYAHPENAARILHALASTTKSLTDADHDIPRRVRGRDLAYASIARRVLDSHAIQPHFQRDAEQIAALLAEAARLGYEMGYGAR